MKTKRPTPHKLPSDKWRCQVSVYGADNCGADWNAETAETAKDYMDMTAFSRQGLIDQLLYEGFTKEQAEYGAASVGY